MVGVGLPPASAFTITPFKLDSCFFFRLFRNVFFMPNCNFVLHTKLHCRKGNTFQGRHATGHDLWSGLCFRCHSSRSSLCSSISLNAQSSKRYDMDYMRFCQKIDRKVCFHICWTIFSWFRLLFP